MSIALDAGSELSAPIDRPLTGAVTGAVAATLRLEGVLALILAMLGYRATGASWWLFAALFLAPDLSMLGYLANRRLGAAVYNIGHTYMTPATVALIGVAFEVPVLLPVALIWGAHIGFDRAMGYGLKHPKAFADTHLGRHGKSQPDSSA